MVEIQNFKLIKKIKLTPDIYELEFEGEKQLKFLCGQFITFLVPIIGGRAYSILEVKLNKIILIIKKREIENGGRGGSKFICELNIGDTLKGIGPAGHFTIKTNNKNKLFLCTGTGFVPLYSQIKGAIEEKLGGNFTLLFGLREKSDIFYIEKLEELKNNNPKFDYKIYLSKEKRTIYNKGYITNFLTKENMDFFDEYYICGAPSMIQNTKTILENHGIIKENILTEEY